MVAWRINSRWVVRNVSRGDDQRVDYVKIRMMVREIFVRIKIVISWMEFGAEMIIGHG